MKNVKRKRGPSFLSFLGSLAAIIFGVLWTVLAYVGTSSLRATDGTMKIVGYAFPIFGIIFILMGIFEATYNFKRAMSQKKSIEEDTLQEDENRTFSLFSKKNKNPYRSTRSSSNAEDEYEDEDYDFSQTNPNMSFKKYCTECGAPLDKNYKYCPECGKKI